MVENNDGRKKRCRERPAPARRGERRTRRSIDVDQARCIDVDQARSTSSARTRPATVISEVTRASCEKDPAALTDIAARLMRREGDPKVSCLSFGLQPGFAAHFPIICSNCTIFHGKCLENSWKITTKKRAQKDICATPWDPKYKLDKVNEKARWYYRFRAFFDAPDSKMPERLRENSSPVPPSSTASSVVGSSIKNSSAPASTTTINALASPCDETATAAVAIIGAFLAPSCSSQGKEKVDAVEASITVTGAALTSAAPIVGASTQHSPLSLTAGVSTAVAVSDTVGVENSSTEKPTTSMQDETVVNVTARSSDSQTINDSNVYSTETLINSNVSTTQPYSPVNENHIITKDAVDDIMKALEERDMKICPLQEHELRLLETLVVDGDTITQPVAKIIGTCLNKKKNGAALEDHERRLLGQLAFKGLKSTADKKLSLHSFKRYKPFQIVRVPEARSLRTMNTGMKRKTHKVHVSEAKAWMSHLSGDFDEELLTSYLKEMPKTAKDLIGSHHPNLYRQSGKETLVLQAYVGLNDAQTNKLGRAMAFFSGGLRIPAPRQERIDLKNQYLLKNHTTLRHDKMLLEQRVKTGGKVKKGTELTREKYVTISRTDPLENVVVKMESLFNEKKLLPSGDCFKEH